MISAQAAFTLSATAGLIGGLGLGLLIVCVVVRRVLDTLGI